MNEKVLHWKIYIWKKIKTTKEIELFSHCISHMMQEEWQYAQKMNTRYMGLLKSPTLNMNNNSDAFLRKQH